MAFAHIPVHNCRTLQLKAPSKMLLLKPKGLKPTSHKHYGIWTLHLPDPHCLPLNTQRSHYVDQIVEVWHVMSDIQPCATTDELSGLDSGPPRDVSAARRSLGATGCYRYPG